MQNVQVGTQNKFLQKKKKLYLHKIRLVPSPLNVSKIIRPRQMSPLPLPLNTDPD